MLFNVFINVCSRVVHDRGQGRSSVQEVPSEMDRNETSAYYRRSMSPGSLSKMDGLSLQRFPSGTSLDPLSAPARADDL